MSRIKQHPVHTVELPDGTSCGHQHTDLDRAKNCGWSYLLSRPYRGAADPRVTIHEITRAGRRAVCCLP